MNLDDLKIYDQLDPQGIYEHIIGLTDQLQAGWQKGLHEKLPDVDDLIGVLCVGMGTSALAAEMLAAIVAPECHVPIIVHRDYDLPAWAHDKRSLVVAISVSGNTEETLSAFQLAVERRCTCLAVTSGGRLNEIAHRAGAPVWSIVHRNPQGTALGFTFCLLLALFYRMGLIADPSSNLEATIKVLQEQQQQLNKEVPSTLNPAKRLAGQLVGRSVTVIGSGILAPAAHSWKIQINEFAKNLAQFDILPEMNHNTLAGVCNPEDLLSRNMVLFLRAPSERRENRLRSDLTRQFFMLQGLGTDFVDALGESRMSNLCTSTHLGDFIGYYLAVANRVEPLDVELFDNFNREMHVP